MAHPFKPDSEAQHEAEQSRQLPRMKRRQLELHDWLKRAAPGLADPYLAAVTMMNDGQFPAREHLVGHIARDIYDLLPRILAGYTRHHANEVIAAVDNLSQAWEAVKDPFADKSAGKPSRSVVELPLKTYQKVQEVIEARRRTKPTESSDEALVRHFYEAYALAGSAPSSHVVDLFKEQRTWFTKFAHLDKKVPSSSELESRFAVFEDMIHSFVAPHFSVQGDLDEIIQQANQ